MRRRTPPSTARSPIRYGPTPRHSPGGQPENAHCLARDAGVSQATGYRYLHEGVDVLAAQAPDLHEVLEHCRREGMTLVILDGTLIETDRLAGVRDNGNDLWYSKKNKAFGGNV